MSDAQLEALCGEAKAQGLRSVVHAHSAESMRAAALAGCSQVEHGVFATPEVLTLLSQRGTYYDPQCSLVFRNYLDNRPKFEGIGNYNAEGFAAMERAIPHGARGIQAGARHSGPQGGLSAPTPWPAPTDATPRISSAGCRTAARSPMAAVVSATSLNAESLGLGQRIGTVAPGIRGRSHRRIGRSFVGHHRAAPGPLRDERRTGAALRRRR